MITAAIPLAQLRASRLSEHVRHRLRSAFGCAFDDLADAPVFAGLGASARFLFWKLAAKWRDQWWAWPSQETLGEHSGATERSQRTWRDELVGAGLLVYAYEYVGQRRRLNYAPGPAAEALLEAWANAPRVADAKRSYAESKGLRSAEKFSGRSAEGFSGEPVATTERVLKAGDVARARAADEDPAHDEQAAIAPRQIASAPPESVPTAPAAQSEEPARGVLEQHWRRARPGHRPPRLRSAQELQWVRACLSTLEGLSAEDRDQAVSDALDGAWMVSRGGFPRVRFVFSDPEWFAAHQERGAQARARRARRPDRPESREVEPIASAADVAHYVRSFLEGAK